MTTQYILSTGRAADKMIICRVGDWGVRRSTDEMAAHHYETYGEAKRAADLAEYILNEVVFITAAP